MLDLMIGIQLKNVFVLRENTIKADPHTYKANNAVCVISSQLMLLQTETNAAKKIVVETISTPL